MQDKKKNKLDISELKESYFLSGRSVISSAGDNGFYAEVDKSGNVISVPLNDSTKKTSYDEIRRTVLKYR